MLSPSTILQIWGQGCKNKYNWSLLLAAFSDWMVSMPLHHLDLQMHKILAHSMIVIKRVQVRVTDKDNWQQRFRRAMPST